MQEYDIDEDLFMETGDRERHREEGVQPVVIPAASYSGEIDPDDQAFILKRAKDPLIVK